MLQLIKGGIYIYPMMLWCKFLSGWRNMAGHGGHKRHFFPDFD